MNWMKSFKYFRLSRRHIIREWLSLYYISRHKRTSFPRQRDNSHKISAIWQIRPRDTRCRAWRRDFMYRELSGVVWTGRAHDRRILPSTSLIVLFSPRYFHPIALPLVSRESHRGARQRAGFSALGRFNFIRKTRNAHTRARVHTYTHRHVDMRARTNFVFRQTAAVEPRLSTLTLRADGARCHVTAPAMHAHRRTAPCVAPDDVAPEECKVGRRRCAEKSRTCAKKNAPHTASFDLLLRTNFAPVEIRNIPDVCNEARSFFFFFLFFFVSLFLFFYFSRSRI